MEARAAEDPEIRRQLDELDRRLAERQGQPRDPGFLPPDTPPEVAIRADADGARTPTSDVGAATAGGGGGFGMVVPVVLVGGGLLAVLAFRRSRARARESGMSPGGIGGAVGTATGVLRERMGEGGARRRFRVGMTVALDPTPFLLLAGSEARVPAPPPGSERASVVAVGRVGGGEGAGSLVRLHLPGGPDGGGPADGGARGGPFVQLHIGPDGSPDEARYFAVLDEVVPADEAEWGAWLDPAEGMIGWSQFQARDGKLYDRVWQPTTAENRVEPRVLEEAVEGSPGSAPRTVVHRSMLYAAPTGAAAPAPETEYLLVEATEDGPRAWVSIRAGLDLNPASLNLA